MFKYYEYEISVNIWNNLKKKLSKIAYMHGCTLKYFLQLTQLQFF